MSTKARIQTIMDVPKKVIGYISDAVTRIFGTSDDDYPKTGVQPFEGEPNEEKHL
ncbi:MAG TPA: hypothetical protein VL134_09980 [Leptolyngbya sp.]|jgi:hypothetical protein|nr:hypothetical protein [Leptolyngbya sp.]